MDKIQLDEASRENGRSRSDDEERWSIESTQGGSSNSGSETPQQTPPCTFSQDIRGPLMRPSARRFAPFRANDRPTATTSALNHLDLPDDPADSRFRGLTPPPLPLGVVPTKKRSLGTLLKDDSDGPQQQDKLSKELERMAPSYILEQHDYYQSNLLTGLEPRPGPSSYTLGHHQSADATPRTVLRAHPPMDETTIPQRRRGRSDLPVSVPVAEQEK